MTVIVKSLSDFFKILVQSFNLSAIFPAFVFITLVELYILPIIPSTSPLYIPETTQISSQIGVTIIAVGIIAYLLDASNFQLIRLFEGFGLRNWFPFNRLENFYRNYVDETWKHITTIETIVDELIEEAEKRMFYRSLLIKQQKEAGTPSAQTLSEKLGLLCSNLFRESAQKTQHNVEYIPTEHLDYLKDSALELAQLANKLDAHKRVLRQEFGDHFPTNPDFVLPTPYGNVIAAAEEYPRRLFNIDTVVLWPYLVPTLTNNGYAQYVIRAKSIMDFLLNLTTVFVAFFFLLGTSEFIYNGLSFLLVQKLIIVGGSFAMLYYLSILGAEGWAATISTAFILFREDLRQVLQLRPIQDYEDEKELWEQTSSFFRAKSSSRSQAKWAEKIFNHPNAQPLND